MTERGTRPLLVAVAAALAATFAVVFLAAVTRGTDQVDAYQRAAVALVAVPVVAAAFFVRPAWPFSIGIALLMFNNHWHDLHVGLPLDRVALGVAVISALVRARRTGSLTTRPIDWLLMVVALYALCSALLAGTLHAPETRFALIDRLGVLAFLLFFCAPLIYRDERDRRVLLGTLVTMGAYLGLTALLETTGPKALIVPHYIADRSVGIHYGRARGPFTESAADGLALFACGVAAAIALFTWRDRRARVAAGAVVTLCGLGALFTLTRSIWLATSVGSLVALVYARETRRFVLPAAGLGLLGVVIAFAAIPGLHHKATARSNDQQPVYDRRNSNDAALRMIAARPVLGFGWGRFRTDSRDYYRQSLDYPLSYVHDVHNVYLADAVELGLLGTGLWLLAVALAFGKAILRRGPPSLRPWRIGLLAVLVSYLVAAMTTPLGYALPTLLLWTWAGICWADIRGTDRSSPLT